MKKLTALLILTTMLLCTACGNSDTGTDNNSAADNSSVSQSEDNSSDTDDTPADDNDDSTAEEQTEDETEPTTYPPRKLPTLYYGLYIPSWFEDMLAADKGLYKETLENGDEVYFLCNTFVDYATSHAFTEFKETNGVEDYTEYDVQDILKDCVYSDLDRYYPSYSRLMSFTTETEESVTVLDHPFVFRTGMLHMEEDDQIADLHYAGYFGVVPYPNFNIERDPLQWLAVCETDDPDTIQHLEELVKNVAEGAVDER